jgi:glycerol-3-phosphate dehydrogenase (NAD(P)+)
MARTRENLRYLPGLVFPEALMLEEDLAAAVGSAEILLMVAPSHGIPPLLERLMPLISPATRIAWAAKGFEPGSGRFLHQVVADHLGADRPGAVITGPSFAKEVADDLPTAVTVASEDPEFAARLAGIIHHGNLRAYTSDDIIGAELGGAVKNVLAVGTGIADGMGLGANSRAALITRGLAEMMRLADALGARRETLMGLSGVGDLVLTSTGDLSRNRRLGLALGRGQPMDQALADIGQVVEGVKTAEEVVRLARRHGLELPISEVVCRIVTGEITPKKGVRLLMSREQKAED